MLTIRRNTTDGSATFFLLGRDPAKVAVGGGQYGVVPSGEFQPASIAPNSIQADLDLWRNIVREYSEELLGQPEYDGSSGHAPDYECWPFYRDLQQARAAGHLRAYVLGVVLHALSLNAVVLTAVVIDDVVFDVLFRDLVSANAEGSVISSLDHNASIRGVPFEAEIVKRLLDKAPLGGTSAACLAIAWNHWRRQEMHNALIAALPGGTARLRSAIVSRDPLGMSGKTAFRDSFRRAHWRIESPASASPVSCSAQSRRPLPPGTDRRHRKP